MDSLILQQEIVAKAANAIAWVSHISPKLQLLNTQLQQNALDTIVSCFLAGQKLARNELTVLPLLSEQLYLLGGICTAAGYMGEKNETLTHNRLCDHLHLLHTDQNTSENLDIVRSVSLPVYCRLIKEGRTHVATLLQSMLHIIAWRSSSPWAREQAQRMLWMGGVFGKGGIDELVAFDLRVVEKGPLSLPLYSLLLMTAFLAQFPAGPIFTD